MSGPNNSNLPLAMAPVKLAVRAAVQRLGGVDGCAAAVGRSRSTVGNWMNLNQSELPTIDCAFVMDQCLITQGEPPMIAAAMARALDHSLICGPDVAGVAVDLLGAQLALLREGGDVQAAIIGAIQDGRLDTREIQEIRSQAADLIEAAQKLCADLALAKPGAVVR